MDGRRNLQTGLRQEKIRYVALAEAEMVPRSCRSCDHLIRSSNPLTRTLLLHNNFTLCIPQLRAQWHPSIPHSHQNWLTRTSSISFHLYLKPCSRRRPPCRRCNPTTPISIALCRRRSRCTRNRTLNHPWVPMAHSNPHHANGPRSRADIAGGAR